MYAYTTPDTNVVFERSQVGKSENSDFRKFKCTDRACEGGQQGQFLNIRIFEICNKCVYILSATLHLPPRVYSGGSALHMFANLDLAAHKASLRKDDIECKPLKRSDRAFDNTLAALC